MCAAKPDAGKFLYDPIIVTVSNLPPSFGPEHCKHLPSRPNSFGIHIADPIPLASRAPGPLPFGLNGVSADLNAFTAFASGLPSAGPTVGHSRYPPNGRRQRKTIRHLILAPK